ncbi:MAG: HDOD domain-containing protein, partial [Candidatus Melainabacteria bacterium]|nr:HDOD domain-containing protein [Candidatus Melainabacteria bacterium]
VGFNAIKNIALFVAARNAINDKKLWFRTVFVSVATKKLCSMLEEGPDFVDAAYMLALFHNIGSLVFKLFYTDEYNECQAEPDIHKRLEMESEKFGINHLELSATLLNKWGFPNDVIQNILNQVSYESHKFTKANAIVELARRMYEVQDYDAEINKNLLKERLTADEFDKIIKKYRMDRLDLSVDLVYGLVNAAESALRS